MMKSNKERFDSWYKKPESKKWMKDYMKSYYSKNKNELLIYQKEVRNNYDKPLKNIVRDKLINIIKNYKIDSILTLESHKFLFSKKLPEKKVIVYEKDKNVFTWMQKPKPKNVKLVFGDISDYAELNGRVDCVYLDFCGNWYGSKETILNLRETIKDSKLFILTLAVRDNQTEIEGDYQFYIISQLQELFNLKVIYGEQYKDSGVMVTIAFEVLK